jgi:hypothetical protein
MGKQEKWKQKELHENRKKTVALRQNGWYNRKTSRTEGR